MSICALWRHLWQRAAIVSKQCRIGDVKMLQMTTLNCVFHNRGAEITAPQTAVVLFVRLLVGLFRVQGSVEARTVEFVEALLEVGAALRPPAASRVPQPLPFPLLLLVLFGLLLLVLVAGERLVVLRAAPPSLRPPGADRRRGGEAVVSGARAALRRARRLDVGLSVEDGGVGGGGGGRGLVPASFGLW